MTFLLNSFCIVRYELLYYFTLEPNINKLYIPVKVKITRIDKSLPLPVYETGGSVGFDVMARGSHIIPPKEIVLIPSNLIVKVPDKYMLVIASRSSTPRKKGITPPHGFGIIDNDYCGSEDEILVQVYNFLDSPVTIDHGDKIAQGVFVRIDKFDWEESDEAEAVSRGKFGSTGGYKN